jgi:drug/metabolite transporter (DMT)-like permease
VWTFVLLGGRIGAEFAPWRGRDFMVATAGQWKPGLQAGALSILTYGLALWALRLGATPRLAALRETSVIFGTAIAVIFLRTPHPIAGDWRPCHRSRSRRPARGI